MALYTAGRTTGLVFDSGDGVTRTFPVFEGFTMGHASMIVQVGGRQVTDLFVKKLTKKHEWANGLDPNVMRKMKEDLCHVSEHFAEEALSSPSGGAGYTLPDGNEVVVAPNVMIEPVEFLFD